MNWNQGVWCLFVWPLFRVCSDFSLLVSGANPASALSDFTVASVGLCAPLESHDVEMWAHFPSTEPVSVGDIIPAPWVSGTSCQLSECSSLLCHTFASSVGFGSPSFPPVLLPKPKKCLTSVFLFRYQNFPRVAAVQSWKAAVEYYTMSILLLLFSDREPACLAFWFLSVLMNSVFWRWAPAYTGSVSLILPC